MALWLQITVLDGTLWWNAGYGGVGTCWYCFICTKLAVWMLLESHDKSREDIQTHADQKAHWLMQSLSVSYHVSH